MPNSKLREKKKKILLQTPPRHNLFTHRHPCHLALFFTLFLSLSHLSPFHLPLTSSSPTLPPPPASSSPSTLYLPWVFPPFASSSLIGLSLTSSPSQLIVSLISYLNSPLPTAPTTGDAALKFFFYPLCFYGGLCMKYAIFFPLLLFDSICEFCGMCYY